MLRWEYQVVLGGKLSQTVEVQTFVRNVAKCHKSSPNVQMFQLCQTRRRGGSVIYRKTSRPFGLNLLKMYCIINLMNTNLG